MSTTSVVYTYKSYTVPGPNELPIYFTRLITIMNDYKSGSTERSAAERKLFPELQEIGNKILEGIYGTTSNCHAYICATRHLCTCFACSGIINSIPSEMYFCDVQLHDINQPEEPTDNNSWYPNGIDWNIDKIVNWTPNLYIDDVHVWKMTTGLIPSLEIWYNTSKTIGMRPITDANKPIFGVTGKKLLVPPHSYFVEGSHQELYEYPYYFFPSEYPEVNGYPNENWKTNGTTFV